MFLKCLFGLLLSLSFCSFLSFGQGQTCKFAEPICSDLPITFPASTNNNKKELIHPYFGCLMGPINPAWYYLRISDPGPINIFIAQYSGSMGKDVDFACWGPFPDNNWDSICIKGLGESLGTPMSHRPPTGDHQNGLDMGDYPRPAPSKMIDCSFTTGHTEWCYIPNGQRGEYYLLCITNFSNSEANISFERLPILGSGTTDCSILSPAGLGDTICYGEDIVINVPTKANEFYKIILPTGGEYPAGGIAGTGGTISITIAASQVASLHKGTHTLSLMVSKVGLSDVSTDVPVIVEELDSNTFSYWRDPADRAELKRSPICEGQSAIFGFGGDIPVDLVGEHPPRFYESTPSGYTLLGTSNVTGKSYQFEHIINNNTLYAVDRITTLGKCQSLKETVTIRKAIGPKIAFTIKDRFSGGKEGNTINDDSTLPNTAAVNIDGYWAPLSSNPWVASSHISPIPDRGTVGNDLVHYKISATPNTANTGIKQIYFLGFPYSGAGILDTLIDTSSETITGVAIDNDGCETRRDTTIKRLNAGNITLNILTPDTTVCGNDMATLRVKIDHVKDDSYFPLTIQWQTINGVTFENRTDLPKNIIKYGVIGDGGNGNGNGSQTETITLARRNDIFTFKARVGTLVKVYAESRALPTDKLRSFNYFPKISRLPLPKIIEPKAFEREVILGVNKDQTYQHFCSNTPVMISAKGVRDYLWTITTPDSPTPVIARTQEVRLPESINVRIGQRNIKLNVVGFNGCANDTSFRYEVLPLPMVNVVPSVTNKDNCVFQEKKLIASIQDKNEHLVGTNPLYKPVTDANYTWKPLHNISSAHGKTVIVSPDTATAYGVTFRDTRGCMDSWFNIIVAPVKVKGWTDKSQYCIKENINLSVKLTGSAAAVKLDSVKYDLIKPDGSLFNLKNFDNTATTYRMTGTDIETFITNNSLEPENGGYNLRFKVTVVRDGCEGIDTMIVKIRRDPNFKVKILEDVTANVVPPTSLPSQPSYSSSTNPWIIKSINDFVVVRLKFDNDSIEDRDNEYGLLVDAKWDLLSGNPDSLKREPYYKNNTTDTVVKITPYDPGKYKVEVTDIWVHLFRRDTVRCSSQPEWIEIQERIGIRLDPTNQEVKTNAYGQRIMSICKEKIVPAGLPVTVKDKNNTAVTTVEQIAWFRVKLDQGKYVPVAGGYCDGINQACASSLSYDKLKPIQLPNNGSTLITDPRVFKGEFANVPNGGRYNEKWLDSLSTFALVVKATSGLGTGYDVLYITVLPQPQKPDFTLDAPLSAYQDKNGNFSFTSFNSHNNYLDSTYTVWCYNEPYGLTFTDKTLNYRWAPTKGIRQDTLDILTYQLSPDTLTLYKVNAENIYGCISTEREVLVHQMTKIDIKTSLSPIICKNIAEEIQLNNILKKDETLQWSLDKKHFSLNDDSTYLVVSYTKNYVITPGDTLRKPQQIDIVLETPTYSYGSKLSYNLSPNNPTIITDVKGCKHSLTLKVEHWLNVPEIGAIVPQDTLLIRYDAAINAYNLCLGTAPNFEVLTVGNAKNKGISLERQINSHIDGNNPTNERFLWNYDPEFTTIDWVDTLSQGTIRPLQEHDIKDYFLRVYNYNKTCKDSATILIQAHHAPKIPFMYAPKRINRKYHTVKFTYEDNPQYEYDWNLDMKSNHSEATLPPPKEGTNYYFEDTNNNKWVGRVVVSKDMGCRVEIPINITRGFYISNTFTPNGDGINDVFLDPSVDFRYLREGIQDFRFSVYSRRGQKLYEGVVSGQNTSIGWDGTYQGEAMPADVYYYVVEYIYEGEPLINRGSVTLLR